MATQPTNRPALPRLALTMGDPSGVGPEVIAAVWADERVWRACRPIVYADHGVMARAAGLIGLTATVTRAESAEAAYAITKPTEMPCVGGPDLDPHAFEPGTPNATSGRVAYDAILAATELTRAGECEAIVTAPISKSGLQAAGYDYPGHTELLAELCGIDEFAMMLYLPAELVPNCRAGLGVIHTTLHTSLRNAIDSLSVGGIVEKCKLAHDAAIAYGAGSPRIGVAALNPHGGEEGLFGDEEIRLIQPAVDQARQLGIDASGPHPVDTLMVRAVAGEFDAVVAMYHDQGHIALKLLGMHGAVNITLGLPIVRTSVAHGTAPDKAWKGIAETGGMIAAIESAAALASRSR